MRRAPIMTLVALAVVATAACSEGGTDAGPASASTSTPPASATSSPASSSAAGPALSDADRRLLAAAQTGDVAGVREALADGGRVEAADETAATALVLAAYGNHVDAAQVLVDAGADVNRQDTTQQSAFLIATSEVGGDPRLLDLTLAHGADVNAKDSYNGTGLIRAAHRGHWQVVDRLIAAGTDLDHVNRLGWTALLEAVILGDGGPDHQKVVKSLVDAGADRSVRDNGGKTALDHARDDGQTSVVALLEKG
jgi:uncharacterized protein